MLYQHLDKAMQNSSNGIHCTSKMSATKANTNTDILAGLELSSQQQLYGPKNLPASTISSLYVYG